MGKPKADTGSYGVQERFYVGFVFRATPPPISGGLSSFHGVDRVFPFYTHPPIRILCLKPVP